MSALDSTIHQAARNCIDLFCKVGEQGRVIEDPIARTHLEIGVGNRLLMIAHNLDCIRETLPEDRVEALTREDSTAMNMHLNSVFIHMRGALDNFGWMLVREWEMQSAEKILLHGQQVNLFGEKFLGQLKCRSQALHELFTRAADLWWADLKDRRDTAAHRFPLYLDTGYPGTSENLQAWHSLSAESERLWRSGKLDDAKAMSVQIRSLLTFQNIYYSNVRPPKSHRLHPDLGNEVINFCDLLSLALQIFFDEDHPKIPSE